MNARRIFALVSLLTILLASCQQSSSAAPVNTPTALQTQTQTLVPITEPVASPVPTQTLVPTSTATLAPNWKFAIPGAPNMLPVELSEDIQYVEPPENCAQENDLNQTCSTRKGQSSDGGFTLSANTAIRLTGDKVYVSQLGFPLMEFYNPGVKQTLWVIVNASTEPITNLHLTAGYGHFRGYFEANWDVPKVENMLGLALYQYIASNNPIPTPEPYGPTPVWNCESGSACEHANVNVAIWTGSEWIKTVGFYAEGKTPSWHQK